MVLTGQPVVAPPDIARVAEPIDQRMDCGHRRIKRKSRKIDFSRKDSVVTPVELYEDARGRVHDHEIMDCAEETIGGDRRELI